ncbi:hypothetical protein HPG69_010262 [Diceros bicornis minor]|uniref:KH-like RNA-binding domain-containing protein n=1 Tax=Diceros bicornis minor TaxID=77932 RepID=A0A7J7EEI2_DICBM|nr:hypothetical protein HPG69_010262 [Diceros bicornis minor]
MPGPHVEMAGSPEGAGARRKGRGKAGRGGASGNHKGAEARRPGVWGSWLETLLESVASVVDNAGAAESPGRMDARPGPGPVAEVSASTTGACPRPWWCPMQELRDPSVFYLEAWLADSIFGERPRGAGGLGPPLGERPSRAALFGLFPGFADRLLVTFDLSLSSRLGPDQALIPELEWMSQALLTVDIVNPRNLVEITIFGQPHVQIG